MTLPAPEGPGYFHQLDPKSFSGANLKHHESLEVRNLASLLQDYVVFTPALIYTHAHLDRDLIQNFMNESPDEPSIGIYPTGDFIWLPDLVRFQDGDWSRSFCIIDREHWPLLERFITCSAVVDRRRKLYFRISSAEITTTDFLHHQYQPTTFSPETKVTIKYFRIHGNRRQYMLKEGDNLPFHLPELVSAPPDDMDIRIADAYLGKKTFSDN